MRIGIDLDEVLCDFLKGLVEFHNYVYRTSLSFDDFFSYEFWKVWGGDVESTKDKMFKFYETSFFDNLKPIKGAVEGVKKLSENHELFVITARQEIIKDKTKVWLDKYFGDVFEDVFVVNHLARSGVSRSKGDVCDELSIDVMIDDSFVYALDCVRSYRFVLLFDNPWNAREVLPEGIVRVKSWDECVSFIESLN